MGKGVVVLREGKYLRNKKNAGKALQIIQKFKISIFFRFLAKICCFVYLLENVQRLQISNHYSVQCSFVSFFSVDKSKKWVFSQSANVGVGFIIVHFLVLMELVRLVVIQIRYDKNFLWFRKKKKIFVVACQI